METNSHDISDLQPEQREAAEKLLGRSLVNFQKVVVRVLEDGNDIVIRFFGGKGRNHPAADSESSQGDWDVPACFNVLSDLTDEEQAEFDRVVSESVTLSRPH